MLLPAAISGLHDQSAELAPSLADRDVTSLMSDVSGVCDVMSASALDLCDVR